MIDKEIIALMIKIAPLAHLHNEEDVLRLCKAVQDVQREEDAKECERMMIYPGGRCESAAHNTVWDAAIAIRANKSSESDLDQATRLNG